MNKIVSSAQDRLYDKIKDVVSIVTAIIPILFGLGYFCINNDDFKGLLIPIGFSLICLGISSIIGFYILWVSKFVYVDPYELIQKYHEEDIDFITLKTASTWSLFITENHDNHNNSAKKYKYMLIFIGLGLGTLIIGYCFLIISKFL